MDDIVSSGSYETETVVSEMASLSSIFDESKLGAGVRWDERVPLVSIELGTLLSVSSELDRGASVLPSSDR